MSLSRNILSTLSARVSLMLLALVSSVVLARALGPEGRGVFALVLLLPEVVTSFGMLGFEQANAVYAGLETEGRPILAWQSVVLAVVVGGAFATGTIVYVLRGAPGMPQLLHGPLWLYVLPLSLAPLRLLAEGWGAILRGMNRIHAINLIEVGSKLTSLSLLFVLVVGLALGVAGAVWADAVSSVGSVLVLFIVLRRDGVIGRPRFDLRIAKRTARFAIPAYIGTILAYLNYRVDQFIVALFMPPEYLAHYVIAVALAERIWVPTGAIAVTLLPHLTNNSKHDPALPAVISRQVLLWTGMVCAAVFALAPWIVRLLYSDAFAPAAGALRWLLPGIVTFSVGRLLVTDLMAREKIMYAIWVGILAAGMNVAGNLILIPRMGIAGASLASSISYTALSGMIAWYYVKQSHVPWSELLPGRRDLRSYATFVHQRLRARPAADAVAGND